jgi:hypothetical protein
MRRLRLLLASALLAALPLAQAGATMAETLEQSVKAAFLPKFARYVDWPTAAVPAAGAPLTLCIVGRDPFGDVIEQAAAGQRIGNHPIALRRVASADDARRSCQIAFVGGSSRQSAAAMLSRLSGSPVLTVTDSRNGSARGVIHFVLHDGRVRFHIDNEQAARNRLSISSRLLSLALSVRQG